MNKIMLIAILLVVGLSLIHGPVRTEAKIRSIVAENVSSTEGASITFNKDGETTTISFSDKELEQIEDDPTILESKLGAKVKCCGPRKKIGDCTWECCNGAQIQVVSCNKTLVNALKAIWG